ncbi:sensor domain-containing diguanylate cyclase [Conexibacter sp. DBS9H8]|uniref:sensor domain-containing diguanylate cyclase n=1 Tax=Conexibacter sp. DBS9H8 TaxID=2937801 RepID=UPI00200CB169|nr:sensor domain-containing diguanylate cyclase [Conexibacter sp. DBS9H8]
MFGLPAWVVGSAANGVIAACYLVISWLIFRGLIRTGQLRANRLAAATALIFFTCAVHHGDNALEGVLPLLIGHDPVGLLARRTFTWQMDVWDIFGAAVGIAYLGLRTSYARLLATPAMFADLDRDRAAAEIARERAALAEAQAVARLGSWTYDPGTGTLAVSAEYRRLFGIGPEEAVAEIQLERIHPEDRPRVRRARGRLLTDGVPLNETFRVAAEGHELVLQAFGHAELDAAGATRLTGTVQDITERVRAEAARTAAEERFKVAFEQAGVPLAIIGLEGADHGRLLDANAAYADMLGVPLTTLLDAGLEPLIAADDRERRFRAPLARLSGRDGARVQFERRFSSAEGREVSALITDAVIVGPDGEQVIIEQALDISDRKRLEGELRHLAEHDPLTGLHNRRRFEEDLEQTLARARRYGGEGALLALDLDGFKSVNDTFGHAAGDRLVIQIAGALRATLRESDFIARTGGDEFAVILPSADEPEARHVADKLLAAVAREGTVGRESEQVRVTASVGIALFSGRPGQVGSELLIEADQAMYEAKAAGRDRVVLYDRSRAFAGATEGPVPSFADRRAATQPSVSPRRSP